MTDVTARYDVIVAGGGAVGLAVALALSRTFDGEMTVAVVDAGTGAGLDGRASALGAGSRRLLAALGVWDSVRADAQDIDAVDITDSRLTDGIRPILLSYESRLDDGEPAMSIVPNASLTGVLKTATSTARGVTLIDGARVERADRPRDRVDVRLSDGRTLSSSLIVAADGRRSPLREAAGIKSVGWPHQQTGIVTTITHELPHHARAVQHFLPGGPFALLPLPGNRACVTWSEDKAEADRLLTCSEAAFLAALDLRAGGRLGALSLAGPRQSWSLDTFLARALIADRLVLVGDAARGVHPIAGQGLNLGLRDVAALTEVIAGAARVGGDIGSHATLETYERWRRADGATSAGAFDALNRLFSNDLTVLRTLRDAGLGVVDRLPMLKRRLVLEAAGLTGEVPQLLNGVLP